MAITQETKLKEVTVDGFGVIFFREETQVYIDGVPFGSPEFHRSTLEPGYLNEAGQIVLNPLPQPPITKGLATGIDLAALLASVRTPAVIAKWKEKLEAEALEFRKAEAKAKADEERVQTEKAKEESELKAKAEAEETARFERFLANARAKEKAGQPT